MGRVGRVGCVFLMDLVGKGKKIVTASHEGYIRYTLYWKESGRVGMPPPGILHQTRAHIPVQFFAAYPTLFFSFL